MKKRRVESSTRISIDLGTRLEVENGSVVYFKQKPVRNIQGAFYFNTMFQHYDEMEFFSTMGK